MFGYLKESNQVILYHFNYWLIYSTYDRAGLREGFASICFT